MKILNYTLALFLLIGITTSCKDDDPETQETNGINQEQTDENQSDENSSGDNSSNDNIALTKTDVVGLWDIVSYETKTISTTTATGISTIINTESYATEFETCKYNFSDNNLVTGEGTMTLFAVITIEIDSDLGIELPQVPSTSSEISTDLAQTEPTGWYIENNVVHFEEPSSSQQVYDQSGNPIDVEVNFTKHDFKSTNFDGDNMTLEYVGSGVDTNGTQQDFTATLVLKKAQ